MKELSTETSVTKYPRNAFLTKAVITFCDRINAHFYLWTTHTEPQLFINITASINTAWVQIKKPKRQSITSNVANR